MLNNNDGCLVLFEDILHDVKSYVDHYLNPDTDENVRFSPAIEFVSINITKRQKEKFDAYMETCKQLSFRSKLFTFIDAKHLTDSWVYKKAHVSRKVFSKIRCDQNYNPSKNTVCALSFALKLSIEDVEDLLNSIGSSLSFSNQRDLIIRYCFTNSIYDIDFINRILETYGEPLLIK